MVDGDCINSWCLPPPAFPDLLAAFAESLNRSPEMRNLTVDLLSPHSTLSLPCRRLIDCCLPTVTDRRAKALEPRPSCAVVDHFPSLPSCRFRSRDPVVSGRDRPVQFSRSLEVLTLHSRPRYTSDELRHVVACCAANDVFRPANHDTRIDSFLTKHIDALTCTTNVINNIDLFTGEFKGEGIGGSPPPIGLKSFFSQ